MHKIGYMIVWKINNEDMTNVSTTNAAGSGPAPTTSKERFRHDLLRILNLIVLALSVAMIVWISFDTFNHTDFLSNKPYMNFQLLVCVFFMLDFFVELALAGRKWRYVRRRILFLLLSIPYLNIINHLDIQLSHDALYFIRFIPLARGALAMSIVISYLSSDAVTSLFMSYLSIMLMVTYFCSLIFYQREHGINPDVDSYWIALWWSGMNLTTVGCYITPMTLSGKIIAMVLPICGTIMFPLFTVYLTNYVTHRLQHIKRTGADPS